MRIVSSHMDLEIHFRFTPRIVGLIPLSLHQTNTSLQIKEVLIMGENPLSLQKLPKETSVLVIKIHFRFTNHLTKINPTLSLSLVGRFTHTRQKKTCILVIKIHFRFTNHLTKIIPTLSLSLVGRFKNTLKRSKWLLAKTFSLIHGKNT